MTNIKTNTHMKEATVTVKYSNYDPIDNDFVNFIVDKAFQLNDGDLYAVKDEEYNVELEIRRKDT